MTHIECYYVTVLKAAHIFTINPYYGLYYS